MGLRFKKLYHIALATILSLGVVFFAMGQMATPAKAVTLVVDGSGQLIGATDIDLGTLGVFNVSFTGASCIAVFGGCDDLSDFEFNNQADATTAAQALLSQVFVNNHSSAPSSLFDTDPELIQGCTNVQTCTVAIPFSLSSQVVTVMYSFNSSVESIDQTILANLNVGTTSNNLTFAHFISISEVPVPAALPLFGTGLALMGILGWRRKRKAA